MLKSAGTSARKSYATNEPTGDRFAADTDSVLEQILAEIGLKPKEISLYRISLVLGPRPASVLAKKADINRSCVYDLLSSMQARGLVETAERNGVRYFCVVPPDRVLSLLKNQKDQIEGKIKTFEAAIPLILANRRSISHEFAVQRFRGIRLISEAINRFLDDSSAGLFSIGDFEQAYLEKAATADWMMQFRQTRISRGISLAVALPGIADATENPPLLRRVFRNPNVPVNQLLVGNSERVLLLAPDEVTQINSQMFCAILHSLQASWAATAGKAA